MLTDQCVSVTDLKKNMNAYVKDLRKDKIIFVNNSPVAVLMDVKKYEKMMREGSIKELNQEVAPKKEITNEILKYGYYLNHNY